MWGRLPFAKDIDDLLGALITFLLLCVVLR
jgi:hypothetical protein